MTAKERMQRRIESQQYWNNVIANLEAMQDWCNEALSYTPSCLTRKTKEEKKMEFDEVISHASDVAKSTFETLVETINGVMNNITNVDSNIVDIDPSSVIEVANEEAKENPEKSTVEETKTKETSEEVVAAEATAETKAVEPHANKALSEKKEDKVVDLEFTVREPGVEVPIPHDPADDMIKVLPDGTVVDTAFTDREIKKEDEEKAEPEVYEFDPVRAQTELMAINKLEQSRMSFDHFSKWVNHTQTISILRDATRNLIVAWAQSLGYAMFDTTAPIVGPEMAPYKERLDFLYSKGVLTNEEYALLERRASHVMRWDYFSVLEEHTLVEKVFTKYFRSVYPWCLDGDKFDQARQKASQENLAYLNSLRKQKR